LNSKLALSQVLISFGSSGSGAGLAVSGVGSTTVSASSFSDGHGSNAGAIFCGNQASLEVSDSSFVQNVAVNSGGAVQLINGCSMNVTASDFSQNEVLESDTPISIGGAVSCQLASLRVLDSSFDSSRAAEGSAIYLFGCSMQLLGSTVSNSQANEGTVYSTYKSQLLVRDSVFANNTGYVSSSGIACLEVTSCEIHSSLFRNHSTSQQGVVEAVNSPSVVLADCDFSFNSAHGVAGAVYLSQVPAAVIQNSRFSFNSAGTMGGAVALFDSSLQLSNSSVAFSTANSGGAIYALQASSLSLWNCSFSGNRALDSGGAIYLADRSSVSGGAVTLSSSQAPYGAGFYMNYYSSATLTSLTAVDNVAGFSGESLPLPPPLPHSIKHSSVSRTGGVFGLFDFASLRLTNSSLRGNRAYLGGVVSAQYYSTAVVLDSLLSENSGEYLVLLL
jgi:predicted outer membrane repeat protein